MSEIINETINELNKPTQNNVFSIEDDPVTVLEKINQVERYLKQIDTSVDTSINTANEALEKANNAFEANGTLVKINGENQLTWSADFAESERQKSKNLCGLIDFEQTVNGVTIKLISSSQTVILNGTATSTFDAMTTVRNMLPYVYNMQGEDLKVSAYYLSGTKSDTAIAFVTTLDNDNVFGDRSAGISLPDSGITSINFSPSKNSTYNTLMLYTVNGASFTNYMFRIQIEKGQVTDWEYPHGAIVHKSEIEPDLIYDIDTKNTIGGTAYTRGINYGTTINNDFTPYKKVKVYAYRQQNGPFTYEINLEQKDLGQNVYSGSGICYSYQEGDNYFVYSSASISENKQQLRIIKCGYTTDFFTTPTLSTTCYIYRLEGYK